MLFCCCFSRVQPSGDSICRGCWSVAQALSTSESSLGSAQNGTIWSYHKSNNSQVTDFPCPSEDVVPWIDLGQWPPQSSCGQHGRPTTLESPQRTATPACHPACSALPSLPTQRCILSPSDNTASHHQG